MSLSKEVVLSQADLNRLNIGKRRQVEPLTQKDVVSKKNRNSGQPYRGRNGAYHPGILPPKDDKACTRCSKLGCMLEGDQKRQLFTEFRALDYNGQSSVLVSCTSIEEPKERTVIACQSKKQFTYKYNVLVNGRRLEVCKATIMDIFSISSDRLKTITDKMKAGELYPRDQRGKHENRPNRITPEQLHAVEEHIRSFPTYVSHYTRSAGDHYHRDTSTISYNSYHQDVQKATIDPSFVVLTGDLQQIFFTPGLKNSSSFYLRKLSNFNFGIHCGANSTGTMCLWNETEAKRGSNEICSCLWKYCTSNYVVLQEGEVRELVIWLDRCRGQNNNFMVIVMLMLLVWEKYFTKVNQKFFTTGHSYNSCDRDFGLIEMENRSTTILVPSDIEVLVRNARVENPFTVVNMRANDFKDFKYQSTQLRRPASLKVTKHLWFQYDVQTPYELLTRVDHSSGIWVQHLLYNLIGNLLNHLPIFNYHFIRPAYAHSIPLDQGKISDLKKLMKFLSGENLTFYEYIMFEQENLFHDPEENEDNIIDDEGY